MGLTIWYCLRTGDAEFRRYPASQYERFWQQQEPLREGITDEAQFVEVFLELEHRMPVRVLRVEFPRYRLDANGYRHSLDVTGRNQASSIVAGALLGALESDDNVYDIAPRIARRQLEQEYRWQASAADVGALCQLINERAGQLILHQAGARLIFS